MQISCVEASQVGTWLLGSPLYPHYLVQKDVQHGHQNDPETIPYSAGSPCTQQIQRQSQACSAVWAFTGQLREGSPAAHGQLQGCPQPH